MKTNDVVSLRARLLDGKGVPCVDVRLIDNLKLANGRAGIALRLIGTKAIASVSAAGIATGFCTI